MSRNFPGTHIPSKIQLGEALYRGGIKGGALLKQAWCGFLRLQKLAWALLPLARFFCIVGRSVVGEKHRFPILNQIRTPNYPPSQSSFRYGTRRSSLKQNWRTSPHKKASPSRYWRSILLPQMTQSSESSGGLRNIHTRLQTMNSSKWNTALESQKQSKSP